MKQQIAKLNYLRIAPRKVRLAADMLRGLSVNEAEARLLVNSRRASQVLLKLLHSAVANAKNNRQLSPERPLIKEIRVDQGPVLKRHLPRAMGRATLIQKKSSHITLVLAESDKLQSPRFKIVKREKVSKKEKTERIKRIKGVQPKEKVEKSRKPEPEKEKAKQIEKAGFIKRIFRRKAV